MSDGMVIKDMVEIPAGRFRMGSVAFYPEEGPVREVEVDGFAIQRGPVTVAEFARFIDAARYVTLAARPLDPADYPGADPSLLVEGSAVFRLTPGPVGLDDPSRWWRIKPGEQPPGALGNAARCAPRPGLLPRLGCGRGPKGVAASPPMVRALRKGEAARPISLNRWTLYRSVMTPRATSHKPSTAAAITAAGRPRRPIQSLNRVIVDWVRSGENT